MRAVLEWLGLSTKIEWLDRPEPLTRLALRAIHPLPQGEREGQCAGE